MSGRLFLPATDVKPTAAVVDYGTQPAVEIYLGPGPFVQYHDLADLDALIDVACAARRMLADAQKGILPAPIDVPRQGPHCLSAGCGSQDCDCRAPCGHPACQAIDPPEHWENVVALAAAADAGLTAIAEPSLEPLPLLPQRTGYECSSCQLANCEDCHQGKAADGSPLACDCATAGHLRKPDDDQRAAAVIEGEPA